MTVICRFALLIAVFSRTAAAQAPADRAHLERAAALFEACGARYDLDQTRVLLESAAN